MGQSADLVLFDELLPSYHKVVGFCIRLVFAFYILVDLALTELLLESDRKCPLPNHLRLLIITRRSDYFVEVAEHDSMTRFALGVVLLQLMRTDFDWLV